MENLSDWIDIIAIIVPLVISLISIYLTLRHIKISNQQFLFDKRLSNYILINEIDDCINQTVFVFKDNLENDFIDYDLAMKYLTNSNLLKKLYFKIDEINHQVINKKTFLKQKNWLRTKAIETQFIYETQKFKILYQFIMEYQKLIISLMNYGIKYSHLHDTQVSLEDALKKVSKEKKEVLINWENLLKLRNQLEIEKLKKELIL